MYYLLLFITSISFLGLSTLCSSLPKEGNFSLATSQQPGPLFGFGQNIIEKNDLQAYLYIDYTRANFQTNSNIMPGILYGIRDDLSLFLNIPVSTTKTSLIRSTGAGVSAQIEYAYFTKENDSSGIQATIVAALSGPNGSMIKQAVSNRQSSTFFLGGTCNYMSIGWYAYGALGELFSIKSKSTKLGNNFLYQFGLGKNIHSNNQHIYLFLIELLGAKFQSDTVNGIIDPTSGGDIIFIAPSLWYSRNRIITQTGLSLPVWQRQSGGQKYDYQVAFNIGWTF